MRDRLGIKPLYHARVGDLLVFASELKCLLASGLVPVDLDYEAIDAYLTLGFVPGPRPRSQPSSGSSPATSSWSRRGASGARPTGATRRRP